MNIQWQFIPGL